VNRISPKPAPPAKPYHQANSTSTAEIRLFEVFVNSVSIQVQSQHNRSRPDRDRMIGTPIWG